MGLDERSDGLCLRDFERGDPSAFEELVLRYQAPLLRHARVLLQSGGAAEDVVQDVFMKLVKSPPVLPPEVAGDAELEHAHLSSWLHRVTRNSCLDVLRSEQRRRKRERAAAAEDVVEGGIASVEGDDTREAVERGLTRLPQDQREVLSLRLLGEQSYKEIASITGKKVGTVGWLVSTGLKALATDLEPLLGGSGGGSCAAPTIGKGALLFGRFS